MAPVAVVAIGGNSLIKDREHQTVQDQYEAICETVKHIMPLIENGYNIVLTHGNGPQVGFILLRSYLSRKYIHEVPLDSCVADTQGALGYQFQMAFYNELLKRNIDKRVVTVVTQVLVDENDPAFQNPTKPVGPFYSYEEAMKKAKEEGWIMFEDAGRGWRRVVPSPEPIEIIEFPAIKDLLSKNYIVVSVGGGGIPVVKNKNGYIKGVAAVIDKDRASSLLAQKLNADLFLISTSVDGVYLNYGTPQQKLIPKMNLIEVQRYLKEGHFKEGSMKPKVESIIDYLKKGGKKAIITSPELIELAILGKKGTTIVP